MKTIICPKCGSYNTVGVVEIPVRVATSSSGVILLSSEEELLEQVREQVQNNYTLIACKDCKSYSPALKVDKALLRDLGLYKRKIYQYGGNLDDAPKWVIAEKASGKLYYENDTLYLEDSGISLISEGDYIIRDIDGTLFVITKDNENLLSKL